MNLLWRITNLSLLCIVTCTWFLISDCEAGLFNRRNKRTRTCSPRQVASRPAEIKQTATKHPLVLKKNESVYHQVSSRKLTSDFCICVLFEYIDLGTFQLYYVHTYDPCPQPGGCGIDPTIAYVAGNNLDAPYDCPEECTFTPRYSSHVSADLTEQPKLKEPVTADFDLFTSEYTPCKLNRKSQFDCEKTSDSKTYVFKHPESDQSVRVKVFFMEITPRVGNVRKTQKIAFGFEVEDDGTKAIKAGNTKREKGFEGYLYSFKADDYNCTVITTAP